MKTLIPFRTTRLFFTGASLLTLALFLAVPTAPASDSPRATYLKKALGDVEAPEAALPG